MPLFLSNGFQIVLFVEGGIIKDQSRVGMEFLAEHRF